MFAWTSGRFSVDAAWMSNSGCDHRTPCSRQETANAALTAASELFRGSIQNWMTATARDAKPTRQSTRSSSFL